jgi:hypothetical protein
VTATTNRDSIVHHGLDWSRMTAPRMAGSTHFELPGIFLCATRDDAEFFLRMARAPSDLWAVSVTGLWLEGDPGSDGGGGANWMILPQPIEPGRLRLLQSDVTRVR